LNTFVDEPATRNGLESALVTTRTTYKEEDELHQKINTQPEFLHHGLIRHCNIGRMWRRGIVEDFQGGKLDVFIGGINAAGEAITLTRADTVIFVELDWVPAALLQAEDRIHRVGQRSNCQVIQLVARIPEGDNLDEMMVDLIGSKVARIGTVLDEDTDNIIAGSIQANLHERLLAGVGQEVAVAPTPTATATEKRKRGRPKIYVDSTPPTATERSKRSIQVLAGSGGKRIMLRLTPEAHEALKVIMALTGSTQETATMNQVLIARKNELL
jgi:hypothetical protein